MKKLFALFLVLFALVPLGHGQQDQTSDVSHTEHIVSENARWIQGLGPGYWVTCTNGGLTPVCTGLVVNVTKGTVWCQGTIRTYAGGTLTMSNNTTNYVYLDPTSNCAPAVSTSVFTSSQIPVAVVVTSGGVVTTITDDRTYLNAFSFSSGGTVTYTSSQSASTADNGKLVAMNCSSSCSYTLPNPQPSTTFNVRVSSIGSTTATIALGASMTYNGGSSVPVLNSYKPLSVNANSSTSTDYLGDSPLVAGTNISFTPASNGFTIAASFTSPISGATANGAVYATGATTATSTGAMTDGEVLIGDSTGAPQLNTITAGGGISVVNGHHTITVSATGSSCSSGSSALVGDAGNTAATPTQVSATIGCNGSLVVIAVTSTSATTNPLTITGTCVTGWTLAVSNVANVNKSWIYYGTSNTTGSCTISSNVTCSSCSISEAEFSNTNATVDKTSSTFVASGTSSITSTIPSLTNSNELVFSYAVGDLTGQTFSATSPMANIVAWTPISGVPTQTGWYQATSASPQSLTWGISCCGSAWWNNNMVVNVAFTTSRGTALFYQTDQVDGTTEAQEAINDFVSGIGISLSGADDSANSRTKVTVNFSECAFNGVNAQTSSYALLSSDAGKLVTLNGSSLTATLPSSPPSSNWCARIQNLNASTLTVSPNGLTINTGSSNIPLAQYQMTMILTDGSNYFATRPIVSGTNISVTEQTNSETVAASGGAASPGLVLVEEHTASSSASLNFTSCISSTYDEYVIEWINIVPATAGSNPEVRMSTNGGSSYDSGSNYQWQEQEMFTGSTGSTFPAGSNSTTSILLSGGPSASGRYGTNGTAHLFNPESTSLYKLVTYQFADESNNHTGNLDVGYGGGSYLVNGSAVNAFQFFMSSGNIASGTVRCYGLTH